MKPFLLAGIAAVVLAHHGASHPPTAKPHPDIVPIPAAPCGFASVPNSFSVTFKNKGLVSDLVNLLNDAPMRESDRAVMRAAVFGEMNVAVDAWCTAHTKHK
jgi:hypothetical protein